MNRNVIAFVYFGSIILQMVRFQFTILSHLPSLLFYQDMFHDPMKKADMSLKD